MWIYESGWLGRLDSNQRMAIPKTAALPLGYAPTGRPDTPDERGLYTDSGFVLQALLSRLLIGPLDVEQRQPSDPA